MAVNYNDYMGFGASADDSGVRHTINHLPAVVAWEPDVYQMENGDYMIGGRNGVMNLQAQQLLNRTEYLKKAEEDLKAQLEATQPGTEKYDELVKRINALDANKENNRINHLERLMANAYLAFQMANIDPDGYDGMIVETFDGGSVEIDQSTTTVKSLVSGDDTVDVEDSSGLIIGAHYQLTDGNKSEEVQIKSISTSGSINRVKLESVVKNQYDATQAKFYRSSAAIYNGKAYGCGNKRTETWETSESFAGIAQSADAEAGVKTNSLEGFTTDGVHIGDEGSLTIGSEPVAAALIATGGGNGTWAQTGIDGNEV